MIILYRYFSISNRINSVKMFLLCLPLFLTLVAIRDYGMETHLTCLLILVYIYLKSIEIDTGKNLTNFKCLILCLLFLTRIDFLFTVIPVMFAADYFLTAKLNRKELFIKIFVTMFTVALIYFLSNYYFFGNFLTITSKIKSSFPEIIFLKNFYDLFAPGTFTNQFLKSFFVLMTVIIFTVCILITGFRRKLNKNDFFLYVICISSLLFIIFNLMFNWFTLKEWYVAFPSFVCSILLVRMLMFFPGTFYLFLTAFTSILIFYFVVTRVNNPKWDSMYYYAVELKKNTNENDRIFMIDLSGIVGYFSERKIINGDGLVNSFEYWKYRDSDSLKKYFEKENINMYSSYSTSKGNHEMKDSAGYLIDKCYSNKFGGYHFTFPKENLILKVPYYYFHAVNSDTGFWYLFKLNK